AALLDVTFFDADGERLAWTDHGVHVGVEGAAALGDALEGLGEDDGAALLGSGLIVSAQPGAAFSAFAAVRARRYPLGGFAGVGEEAVASLDVVPLFEPVEVDGEVVAGRPLGIRAIARDDQQRPIYGAPVRWEVIEGRLGFSGVEVDDDGAPAQPEGERIYPNDACEPPPLRPQRRSATLVATVGGERARVELEWTALPPAEDEGYAEDPTCQGPGVAYGCVCAAGSRGGGEPLAALFLLALVRGRRRVGRRR
ncbi:MAG: hypothetical protein KC636_29055, partial [Myxococcales bacterium]|nr:hypothetical protein [Myxococcales bacterium]